MPIEAPTVLSENTSATPSGMPLLTAEETVKLNSITRNIEKVALLCEFVLIRNNSLSDDKPMYTSEIKEAIRNIYPELFMQISDSTFPSYINQAPAYNSKIKSLGTARGYYYDINGGAIDSSLHIDTDVIDVTPVLKDDYAVNTDAINIKTSADINSKSKKDKVRKEREKLLYIHVADFLRTIDYRAMDVASSRSLGPWGNPDVVGIRTLDIFDSVHIHTVSVEVKVDSENWQRDIFEAISHRRYFDRVYFCFADVDGNSIINQEMKDYAELYSVGIIVVELTKEERIKLLNAEELNPENISVKELCPAPYSQVMPNYRRAAFEALGIRSRSDLYTWGR
jgi:hypothetical protein